MLGDGPTGLPDNVEVLSAVFADAIHRGEHRTLTSGLRPVFPNYEFRIENYELWLAEIGTEEMKTVLTSPGGR